MSNEQVGLRGGIHPEAAEGGFKTGEKERPQELRAFFLSILPG